MNLSKDFKKIFKNFNVYDQIDNIKTKLSPDEKYLLLICCSDLHDSDDDVVKQNFKHFEKELSEILDYQVNDVTNVSELLSLESSIGKWIPTSELDLPKVFTKSEVREIKIKEILKK